MITNRLGEYCRLINFVEANPRQILVDLYSDAGVAFYAIVKLGGKYKAFVIWLGQWHVLKSFTQIVYKILHVIDLPPLLVCWGKKTPKAQAVFMKVKNMHNSFIFVRDGLIPVFMELLLAKNGDASSSSSSSTLSFDGFIEYLFTAASIVNDSDSADQEDSIVDATCQFYADLLLFVLLPLDLLKSAIRNNDMAAYDAVRLKLLPLCFAFHNTAYGPRHVREIIQM